MHRSSSPRRFVVRALTALLLAAPLACGSPVATADLRKTSEGEVEAVLFDGLVQRITITPSDPQLGGEVEIRSVLVNKGRATLTFLANVCTLNFESELEISTPVDLDECKGLPREAGLAPGDSTEVRTRRLLNGTDGVFEIRVLHVLEPLHWVPVRVRVQPLS